MFRDAEKGAIAVLSHNKPKGYFVSPKDYELMISIIDEWRKEHPEQTIFSASVNPNAAGLKDISMLGGQLLHDASSEEHGSFTE